jgi:hypothetical protein
MVELGEPDSMPTVTHVPIETRPMLALKPVYPSSASARDVADRVLGELQKLQQPEAMVSVALRDFDRPARREIESILRRESGEFVWLVHFAAERQFLLEPSLQRETVQTTDLRTLFAQFVEERTGAELSKEFATKFLERGDRALELAIATAEAEPGEGGAQ